MNQEKYNYIDTLIKILGVVALLISGVFGFIQYKDIQEREYKKPFYEKQIEVVDELFEVLGDIDKAQSPEEKVKAAVSFWIIYNGESRTFLDSKMVRALDMPADYVVACINKVRKPTIVSCENFTASRSAIGFAKVAREQLSLGWKMSFDEIGRTDPWAYTPD